MRDKRWAAVPLLDPAIETQWFASLLEAEEFASEDDEPRDIQYRPGRKPKPKPKPKA